MPTFGDLLRAHRLSAGLKQTDLAECANMSARAIRALESGKRKAPHRHSVAALTQALKLTADDAAGLKNAASRARLRPRNVATAIRGNVPLKTTTFVGREELLTRASEALQISRFVAFTGRGGVGKSRCATVLADRSRDDFTDGTWFVDLSATSDEASIVAKIAATMAVTTGGFETAAALAQCIARQNCLLILDNCEAVAFACEAVAAAIVDGCAVAAVIVTSTVRFGASDTVFDVPPLACATTRADASMTDVRSSDAVRLFLDRCRQYGADLEECDDIAPLLASICRRLEGVPLSIELAASRARGLGLKELDRTLGQWIDCSAGAFADAPERQSSLFAAIDWSYRLLEEHERRIFRRLSIFRGGFTLEAAEAICHDFTFDGATIRGDLIALADRSLITIDSTSRGALFESIRAYGERKLHEHDEFADVTRRHIRHFASTIDDGTRRFYSSSGAAWAEAVRRDDDNFSLAIANALRLAQFDIAAHFAVNLHACWLLSDRCHENARLSLAVLPRVTASDDPRLWAGLLVTRAVFEQPERAIPLGTAALQLYVELDDAFGQIRSGAVLAESLALAGRKSEALAEIDAAIGRLNADAAFLAVTYPRLRIQSHIRRGYVLGAERPFEARREFRAALALARENEDRSFAPWCSVSAAEGEAWCGDLERAEAMAEQNVYELRSAFDLHAELFSRVNLVSYKIALDKIESATTLLAETLNIAHASSHVVTVAIAHAAAILAKRGSLATAARLRGYLDGAFARHVREGIDQRLYDVLCADIEADVSPADRKEFTTQGALLTEAQALALTRVEIAALVACT